MGKRARIIQFDQLSTNGIVYERVEKFSDSIFVDVYEKAKLLVEEIVDENDKWGCSEKKRVYPVNTELSNVISFIGRRGTGKTSAMLSFYEALLEKGSFQKLQEQFPSKKSEKGNDAYRYGRRCRNSINFMGLECIDASSLEDSEDVFILVLANMLDQILDISRRDSLEFRDYENRSLLQKFEEIYENFLTLKSTSELEKDGYSNFEKLKSIASSRKIREQFAGLVDSYLKIMGAAYSICNDDNSYLVIAIDDLDMRRQGTDICKTRSSKYGSYEIMRSIHQYLSVPRVIILTAYNHEYLYEQCKGYFGGSNDLTSQFMEKIFAVNARLYMPSWRKRDFDNEIQIQINIRDNRKGILKPFQEKEDGKLPIKQFILALLGEKADIYFDCKGLKKHFFEPDTLRSLYSMTEYLLNLKDYGSVLSADMDLEAYELDIKRLKDDFFFRYVKDKLVDPDEQKMFEQWLEQKIGRRSEAIVALVCQHTQKLGKRIKLECDEILLSAGRKGQSIEEVSIDTQRLLDNSKVDYSFAELVHSIYHMTRDNNHRYSKELVACILESYTLYLTGIYRKYGYYKRRISKDDFMRLFRKKEENLITTEEKKYCKEVQEMSDIFKWVVGHTICGKWSEYYFPEVRINMIRSKKELLRDNPQSLNYIIGYVDNCNLQYQFELKCMGIEELEKNRQSIEKDVAYKIKRFLFLAMVQTSVFSWLQDALVCKYEVAAIENQNSAFIFRFDEVKMNNKQLKNDFDLSACFKYTLFYTDILNKLEELIQTAIQNMKSRENQNLRGNDKVILSEYEKIIKSVFDGLWNEYYTWDKDYGNMMIPVYNLDLSYNVIKRVFQDCKKAVINPIYVDDRVSNTVFLQEYKKMLNRFVEHFNKVDEYYCIDKTKKGFAQVFINCPFYKMVDELAENPMSNESISLSIKTLVGNMVNYDEELTVPEEQI